MYNSGLVENIKILYLHFELETEIIAAASVLAKYYSYRTKGYLIFFSHKRVSTTQISLKQTDVTPCESQGLGQWRSLIIYHRHWPS